VFDYSGHMRHLIGTIAATCSEFRHIDAARLLVSLTPARSNSSFGLHAKIVPMRFSGGRRSVTRAGTAYRMPTISVGGSEILYIIYFCLPRFQDQSLEDKLSTVFHELYHISPKFNGDLRRFEGRNSVHGSSWKKYEQKMSGFAADYLDAHSDRGAHQFLKFSYRELVDRFGEIVGLRIKEPKPIYLDLGASRTRPPG